MVATRLSHLVGLLKRHRGFVIVVTLLTLATTYPTIVYVIRTDVFWHPAGALRDVYIEFWDVWYGAQFLTGRADPFYTNLIFYPDGLSLANQSFAIPHIIAVNALNLFLPISNAMSLAYLLIIISCALSAYVYLLWLFKDKWIALFGAVVFGLAPRVVGAPHHPDISLMATAPLMLYCLHRGVKEDRRLLVLMAGLLAGLGCMINLYLYVCGLILLGCFVCAFAVSRWRDPRFWQHILLLALAIALSSLWRLYPLLSDAQFLDAAVAWHGDKAVGSEVLSFFVNNNKLSLSALVRSAFEIKGGKTATIFSVLGFLPLLLIGAGFLNKGARRKMLPWALCCGLFLVLRLGSHLTFNGAVYPDIRLPKFYLDQLFPFVFKGFWDNSFFMIGALTPFAALACFGLAALQERLAIASKPPFILALVLIVAVEYHIPVQAFAYPMNSSIISIG